MYSYICLNTCKYIHTYNCIHMSCTHAGAYTRTRAHMCVYAHTQTQTSVHEFVYVYMRVCVNVHVCVYLIIALVSLLTRNTIVTINQIVIILNISVRIKTRMPARHGIKLSVHKLCVAHSQSSYVLGAANG